MASSSRGIQQDSFIDDDDLTCPLCVEEFDLSDRNFRPCPCGYQVCQFCFNNIKTNMNGLCPACRRPYDEKTIEWKVVTQEEIAQFKAKVQKDAKKKLEQRQKEAQKREQEHLNRKHLQGIRVVQKNLVYVVGLSQGIPESELLQTLRGDKYFGQYGKILKIVVSKPKQSDTNNGGSLGVYVTFAREEDAAKCIAAVNGSTNLDRVLRAQFGTTKYCSAYIRNETCTNKQCMFLHEPGDNEDSYSRQDLSSINGVSTQRPLGTTTSSSRQAAQNQAPLQHQPVAAASHHMARESSKDGSDSGDGSALPSSASWANRGAQQRSRRGSIATSGAEPSPATSTAIPAQLEVMGELGEENHKQQDNGFEETPDRASSDLSTSPESTRTPTNPVLVNLVKTISFLGARPQSPSEISPDDLEAISHFPPLFDEEGGLKRLSVREQQEEARFHIEQESQNESRPIPEPQEEEPPESGSLQLGGEPEDGVEGREGGTQPQGFHDHRRLSAQPPIQRTSSDGVMFGNIGQNFPQNLNLSSINGRTLTPLQQQQLLLLKSSQPQSGFIDQFPPGMSPSLGPSQSSLFQQQGHNRQSSRYNFANEAATAPSIKPSNPKLVTQSSMMLSQQGNPFYGSSIPGPPPGLKSTGTPPISAGGMFSQSHGFGSTLGGNFGATKENSNEMLREMLRNRSGVNGGQGHDAGKREFLFPSPLHQYPSTSTPAPASGLLASLYGPQPGAFQDFGPKQKKKGKKHRHANTSSSGGGVLVDLADPNILQARMPHPQQQSNAGVGQGLFGGQGQEEQIFPLDEASRSVDALVADGSTDNNSIVAKESDFIFRLSTPSIPPGLNLPHAHPSPSIREDPTAKQQSHILPTSASIGRQKNLISSDLPRATPLMHLPIANGAIRSVLASNSTEQSNSGGPESKQNANSSATYLGIATAITTQVPQGILDSVFESEDFPRLEKGKERKTEITIGSKGIRSVSKSASNMTPAAQPTDSSGKGMEKRSTPGILNISMATHVSNTKSTTNPEILSKSVTSSVAFPPLPRSTGASTKTQPPALRISKTFRLAPSGKNESTSAGTPTPLSSAPPLSARQPSIASLTRLDRPSTPVSEIVSDNASMTSNSISRPGSPPQTRVGSAPVRMTTKSQQKKQRREAQKEKEKTELDTVVDKQELEVEIGPIMGRKKKQKKEKVNSAGGGSTPVVSRSQSPGSQEMVELEKRPMIPPVASQNATSRTHQIEMESPTKKSAESKGKGKAQNEETISLEPPTSTSECTQEAAEKPIPTPSSILQDLVSSGLIPDSDKLAVLKAPASVNQRVDNLGDLHDLGHKLIITEDDRATLQAGKPVHKVTQGTVRIMLTPNGDCVRNLTSTEEERYLELQSRIRNDSGPTAFVSQRNTAGTGFTLIGGRAVPNGPPSFLPLTDKSGVTDPVSRIQRDEALNYINQFVLPSLSANSQLEMALNANSFDTEMSRPKDSQAWGGCSAGIGHGSDVLGTPGDDHICSEALYGPNTNDGVLARGLESMTANLTIGRDTCRGHSLGNVTLLSLADSESALQNAKRETEKLEKNFNQLLKKNRRLLLGAGH